MGNMQTPAAAKAATGKRKSSSGKPNSKDMIVDLLMEMRNKQAERLVRFGIAKSTEATEMKKNINAMICSQATSARNAASKNAMALLQFKLNIAHEALEHANTTSNHNKYRAVIEKSHHKMDKYLWKIVMKMTVMFQLFSSKWTASQTCN
jgi:hypothetical protein